MYYSSCREEITREGVKMAVVIYFSKSGENLIDGKRKTTEIGNTKILAEKIAKQVNCNMYEIQPLDAYPLDYEQTLQRSKKELTNLIYPAILSGIDISEESTIFLGFPNWWNDYPMPVGSFLKTTNLEGKKVYPFCTHEGSSFGISLEHLRKECPEAKIQPGLPIRGSHVERSDEAIRNWLCHYLCTRKNKSMNK